MRQPSLDHRAQLDFFRWCQQRHPAALITPPLLLGHGGTCGIVKLCASYWCGSGSGTLRFRNNPHRPCLWTPSNATQRFLTSCSKQHVRPYLLISTVSSTFHPLANCNRPLLPLLCSLLDAVQTTAAAVADNAWDDGHPLDAPFVAELVDQVRRIGLDIESATQGPSH
jgi:hypothetical protein